mmetsp:Transcript_32338/g.53507  ORF Transcript_32338/g.53507 Transcript_32338/m.53507 type:complete len:396 (+) Transcript_32338:119-1306(+)
MQKSEQLHDGKRQRVDVVASTPTIENSERKGEAFPVMSEQELALLLVPFTTSPKFGAELRQTLAQQGVAVVTGILTSKELEGFEMLWQDERQQEPPHPLGSPDPIRWQSSHGEFMWRARLHPRVRASFASAFNVEESSLTASADVLFWADKCTPTAEFNKEWLHVDQNHLTGLTHLCYQGALYVWPADASSSTTVVWPGSHLEFYNQLLHDPYTQERATLTDSLSIRYGHFVAVNSMSDQSLKRAAIGGARRVPVPAGALLLWDSRTVHQGWQGGPRLAATICWEPRSRLLPGAAARKLLMAAAGIPSVHSPSEGRFNPAVSSRRGEGAKLSRPSMRPYAVSRSLPDAEWKQLWAEWAGKGWIEDLVNESWAKRLLADDAALKRALRPEVLEALL